MTRALIWMRRNSAALSLGDITFLPAPDGALAYIRQYDTERVFVALNFTNLSRSVSLPGLGYVAVSTHMDRDTISAGTIGLRPNEGLVVRLK
jgi:alpha-glucosidase